MREDGKVKYTFHLEVEGNDKVCMYMQKKEYLTILAKDEIEALNMMIEHCLKEDYQKFRIESFESV